MCSISKLSWSSTPFWNIQIKANYANSKKGLNFSRPSCFTMYVMDWNSQILFSINNKGGCAHCDMCILDSKLIDLDPWDTFAQFYLKITFYFLSWGKSKYVTLGMGLLWKYNIRKLKVGIFCYNFQIILNLKLKFWGL